MKEENILKNELKELLEGVSDLKVLRSIKEFLESKLIEEAIRIQLIENAEKSDADLKANDEFIGISSEGNPLSVDRLRKELLEASKRVKSGKFFTQEEIENESKSW
jgi:hypothetical protein